MIRRANQPKHGAAAADLLVCFPTRAHLTLLPKKTCSPGRLIDPSFHRHRRRQMKKLPSRRIGQTSSPVSWDRGKTASSDASEPSSPKVTCAGQIKVRPRSGASCKSWQSVMEEIERIHKKQKSKKASWGEALGLKKEVMQFLSCLRNMKLDFRCLGGVPECDLSSDEEEEEADQRKSNNQSEKVDEREKRSRSVFSNWFMVVQEENEERVTSENEKGDDGGDCGPSVVQPPTNALLLMRCRSAPAKSWLENREKEIAEDEEEEEEEGGRERMETKKKERKKLRDYLLVMECEPEYVAKERWVVGSINRSRSWKR